jgi:hypothetical protein
MSEVCKKGARAGQMSSDPIVLLTLYPLPSFRPRLFISLTESMYTPCVTLSHMDCTKSAHVLTQYVFIPQSKEQGDSELQYNI